MRSGRLRQRITIQSRGEIRDADGGSVAAWADFAASVPAEVVPLSGREFMSATAMQDEIQARITIRYLAGVIPSMRVVFDGLNYNIVAVLPDPTARRHINLMVNRGLNDG
jgi:SPP1 family predicted phage head-tail adaptor